MSIATEPVKKLPPAARVLPPTTRALPPPPPRRKQPAEAPLSPTADNVVIPIVNHAPDLDSKSLLGKLIMGAPPNNDAMSSNDAPPAKRQSPTFFDETDAIVVNSRGYRRTDPINRTKRPGAVFEEEGSIEGVLWASHLMYYYRCMRHKKTDGVVFAEGVLMFTAPDVQDCEELTQLIIKTLAPVGDVKRNAVKHWKTANMNIAEAVVLGMYINRLLVHHGLNKDRIPKLAHMLTEAMNIGAGNHVEHRITAGELRIAHVVYRLVRKWPALLQLRDAVIMTLFYGNKHIDKFFSDDPERYDVWRQMPMWWDARKITPAEERILML